MIHELLFQNWRKGKLPSPGAPQNVIEKLMKSPEIQQQLKSTTTTTTTTTIMTPKPTTTPAQTSVGPQKKHQKYQYLGGNRSNVICLTGKKNLGTPLP